MKKLFIICLMILSTNGYVVSQEDNSNVLFNITDIENYPKEMLPWLVDNFYNYALEGYERGPITKAINYSNKALYIIDQRLNGNHPKRWGFVRIMAITYDKLGDFKNGLKYHQMEVDYFAKHSEGSSQNYAISLLNLAICYSQMKDFSQAINFFNKAIPIVETSFGKNDAVYVQALCNMALCYSDNGENTTAIKYYKKAQIICENNKIENSIYGNLCCNMAYSYYKQKDYLQAIDLCRFGLELISNDTDVIYINHLCNLSVYYYKALMPIELIRCWKRCVHLISHHLRSQLSFGLLTQQHKDYLWNNIVPEIHKYNSTYSLYIAGVELLSPFWYNIFTEVSYNSLLISKGGLLRLDSEIIKNLYSEGLSDSFEKFEEQSIVGLDGLTSTIIQNNDMFQQRNTFRETHFIDVKWRHVYAKLYQDIAIEILAADEFIDQSTSPYYAALVLRQGWDAPKFVELCETKELQACFKHENGLAKMYSYANSRKLYNLIWSKLEPYINDGDNVYFSPAGLLHQMNIEVFQDANGTRANEKWNLHRVSSTRELCMEKPEIELSSAALYGNLTYEMDSTVMIAQSRAYKRAENYIPTRGFVADSTMRAGWGKLPATKSEILNIQSAMQANSIETTVYTLDEGTEESFKALSGKKTPIIHIATHGFFYKNEEITNKKFFETLTMTQNYNQPDNSLKRSGLILAGAQKAWLGEPIPNDVEDGILLAEEIATMDLTGTDLVVLSACETGLGEITSEGVFGLQRAFKKAGVQTLIMSLWRVDDEATSLFMRTFYKEWLGGKSKHDAFVATQTFMQSQYADPYYWAGFIMLD